MTGDDTLYSKLEERGGGGGAKMEMANKGNKEPAIRESLPCIHRSIYTMTHAKEIIRWMEKFSFCQFF